MEKEKIKYIIQKMEDYFPNAHCELNFTTPFQLVMSVILSAQTTDKQVNKITKNLFKEIKTPKDLLSKDKQRLENKIKSIWLYKNKSKYILDLAKILYKKYNSQIPNNMEELKKLPWIWEKSAKVILAVLYKKPYIAVDTHVHRITNRLWIVNTKTPLETSAKIEKIVPKNLKIKAHHLFIFWGRYFCKAKNPNCCKCPFISFCKFYNLSKQNAKRISKRSTSDS